MRVPILWKLPTLPRVPLTAWRSTLTVVVGPAGKLTRCTESIEGLATVLGPSCRFVAAAPDSSRARFRDPAGAQDQTFVIDTRMSPGPTLPRILLGDGRGEVLIGRVIALLTVDGEGKLMMCDIVERRGPPAATALSACERNFPGPYVASGSATPLLAHALFTYYRRR